MAGWLVTAGTRWPTVQHVVPQGDRVEHDIETFGACACGPRAQAVGAGWLIVHNSLDGRELSEV